MVSRPIIAGVLAGLAFGQPAHGLVVGAILEVFALVILPFGAARYPESGTAAAAAAAAYSQTAPSIIDQRLLLLAIVFALAWEQIAGASVVFMRRVNERIAAVAPAGPDVAAEVTRRQILGFGIDALRGACAVVLGAVLGTFLLRSFSPHIAISSGVSAQFLMIGTMGMLGAVLSLFGGMKERKFAYTAGLACGALVLLL